MAYISYNFDSLQQQFQKHTSLSMGGSGGGGVDRISVLPAHLKENILERVSIKDAMKTSVLSSEWRYCWTGIRKLNLNDFELVDAEELRKAIDRILLLHKGPIRQFTLCIPCTVDHQNFNLSVWFHVLSENGIHDIVIDGSDCYNAVVLPSSLLHCRELKTLRLCYCELSPPPRFVGFCNLLSLEMDFCSTPSLVLGSLISQCPLLEKLSLMDTHTRNHSQHLVINALNLRTAYFEDELLGCIIFKNIPRLTDVTFTATEVGHLEPETPRGSWSSFCSLSGIMKLEVNLLYFGPMIDDCPRCLPTTFEKLKTLTLTSLNASIEDDICIMFCLIRSSPGLEYLTIMFGNSEKIKLLPKSIDSGEAAQKLLETEAGEECKLSNLSTVNFEHVEGLSHEMLLIKIMLSRCPYLESFEICPNSHKTTKDDEKRILRELKQFPNMDKLIYCK